MANEIQSFRHFAMNTWFEVSIAGQESDYARKAATEAFHEIDRLENLLSRFREGSDIDILNKKGSKEPVRVTEETWDCLLTALDLEILTEGRFSVAFEYYMEATHRGEKPEVASWLEMDADRKTVLFKQPELMIDLGGIGKGFALDWVVEHLQDWEIDSLLIHSGTSSVVARGSRDESGGWPISVGADEFPQEIALNDLSLSGSSLAVQGAHILDVKAKSLLDTERRAWAWASSGVLSDALSTSFMLMAPDEIDALCQRAPGLGALVVDPALEPTKYVFGVANDYVG
ncbi:FAD:protein FMN transferase [Opitutia bacterium ISCC 51]|nr:FAD:protein FMN transferase [Opitutae bacterium ISCC 51]